MPIEHHVGRSPTELFPTAVKRLTEFDHWAANVRDPAREQSEGPRRIACEGARAEYEISLLPDGRWAVRMSLEYRCGNCWGRAIPWTDYATRRECVDTFIDQARRHFGKQLHPADSCVSQAQHRARQKMQQLLTVGLFGFVEPKAEPASTDSP